jgi:hypothetical protein
VDGHGGRRLSDEVEQRILAIEARLDRARVAGDLSVFEEVLGDEFRSTNAVGMESGRQQMLDDVRTGTFKVRASRSYDIAVHVYGDTAVVRGLVDLDSTYKGIGIAGTFAYSHVYVLRDGRPQVVAAHTSALMPAPLYLVALRFGNLGRRLRARFGKHASTR